MERIQSRKNRLLQAQRYSLMIVDQTNFCFAFSSPRAQQQHIIALQHNSKQSTVLEFKHTQGKGGKTPRGLGSLGGLGSLSKKLKQAAPLAPNSSGANTSQDAIKPEPAPIPAATVVEVRLSILLISRLNHQNIPCSARHRLSCWNIKTNKNQQCDRNEMINTTSSRSVVRTGRSTKNRFYCLIDKCATADGALKIHLKRQFTNVMPAAKTSTIVIRNNSLRSSSTDFVFHRLGPQF